MVYFCYSYHYSFKQVTRNKQQQPDKENITFLFYARGESCTRLMCTFKIFQQSEVFPEGSEAATFLLKRLCYTNII